MDIKPYEIFAVFPGPLGAPVNQLIVVEGALFSDGERRSALVRRFPDDFYEIPAVAIKDREDVYGVLRAQVDGDWIFDESSALREKMD